MSTTSEDTPKKTAKSKKGAEHPDANRFQSPGINYRGKLIGVEDVPIARGEKMCQVAMAKLKAAVKAMGEHKQKIMINVSLDGVRINDERTDNLIYFHPVEKISFISRDIGDSRAFGYVYGQEEGRHQFMGIKTERVAENIVLNLRDIFQIVYEMKKQEREGTEDTDRRIHENKNEWNETIPDTSSNRIKISLKQLEVPASTHEKMSFGDHSELQTGPLYCQSSSDVRSSPTRIIQSDNQIISGVSSTLTTKNSPVTVLRHTRLQPQSSLEQSSSGRFPVSIPPPNSQHGTGTFGRRLKRQTSMASVENNNKHCSASLTQSSDSIVVTGLKGVSVTGSKSLSVTSSNGSSVTDSKVGWAVFDGVMEKITSESASCVKDVQITMDEIMIDKNLLLKRETDHETSKNAVESRQRKADESREIVVLRRDVASDEDKKDEIKMKKKSNYEEELKVFSSFDVDRHHEMLKKLSHDVNLLSRFDNMRSPARALAMLASPESLSDDDEVDEEEKAEREDLEEASDISSYPSPNTPPPPLPLGFVIDFSLQFPPDPPPRPNRNVVRMETTNDKSPVYANLPLTAQNLFPVKDKIPLKLDPPSNHMVDQNIKKERLIVLDKVSSTSQKVQPMNSVSIDPFAICLLSKILKPTTVVSRSLPATEGEIVETTISPIPRPRPRQRSAPSGPRDEQPVFAGGSSKASGSSSVSQSFFNSSPLRTSCITTISPNLSRPVKDRAFDSSMIVFAHQKTESLSSSSCFDDRTKAMNKSSLSSNKSDPIPDPFNNVDPFAMENTSDDPFINQPDPLSLLSPTSDLFLASNNVSAAFCTRAITVDMGDVFNDSNIIQDEKSFEDEMWNSQKQMMIKERYALKPNNPSVIDWQRMSQNVCTSKESTRAFVAEDDVVFDDYCSLRFPPKDKDRGISKDDKEKGQSTIEYNSIHRTAAIDEMTDQPLIRKRDKNIPSTLEQITFDLGRNHSNNSESDAGHSLERLDDSFVPFTIHLSCTNDSTEPSQYGHHFPVNKSVT